ncbi:MAG: ORF6N domain-containing protein [Bacteroidales bacterium]|nr:ORF6N domain-containing protein [Bacteroidales bacterium]
MKKLKTKNEIIDRSIFLIRNQKVMIDTDLAELYGVETKRLNEQVKRNINRFPIDFMFQLTDNEKNEVVAICDHLEKIKFRKSNPYAFTEHGTIMLASVLNTPIAIQTSVLIVRAFVKLRHRLLSSTNLERKLYDLEYKYDKQFKSIFDIIKQLIAKSQAPETQRSRMGYKRSDEDS